MSAPASQLYNVVILPVTPADEPDQHFQLSAGRRDGARRLVSPHLTRSQVRAVLWQNGTPGEQVEQLFRGNRMAFGGRDSRRLFFTEEALLKMGLQDASKPDAGLGDAPKTAQEV